MATELYLEHASQTPTSTLSLLWDGSDINTRKFLCFIIEDGYKAIKVPGSTRIPHGRYKLIKRTWGEFYKKYKQRYNHPFVIEISKVPGFSDILFHIGNYTGDTRGCLLTNDNAAFQGNEFSGLRSAIAYEKFMKHMIPLMDGDVYLNIMR